MNPCRSRLIFAGDDTTLPQVAASIPIICRDDLPQRTPVVLDSTGDGEDTFAATRWNSRRVEHLHALFPGAAVGGILVRARNNLMDRSSQASTSAQRPIAALVALLASRGLRQLRLHIGTKLSGAVALRLPAQRDRLADLHHLDYESFVAEMVHTHRSSLSKRSVLSVCHQ